jgi:hypothetical protein
MSEGCICEGNWRKIVAESEPLFDKEFIDRDGERWKLLGIVHGSDDYYYLMGHMAPDANMVLFSCVGNLKIHGFTLA